MNVIAFGISDITADLPTVNLARVAPLFSGVELKDIQRPAGKVDPLLGIHEARLFPNLVLHSHNNLLLYQSFFGSGLILVGHHPLLNPGVVVQNHKVYERAQANYGKQVHHVLSMQGIRQRELQENYTIHLDPASTQSPALHPRFSQNDGGGTVAEELGGEVVEEESSPENPLSLIHI